LIQQLLNGCQLIGTIADRVQVIEKYGHIESNGALIGAEVTRTLVCDLGQN
jgi:hypothetical protein